ncbi:hypothetical protein AMQ68_04830 [Chryseobacterium sp. ERMR1:04]|nr:hypothetical protein AMQ68_04830 [Chryseobacterium sp. ERMR1:04]
MCFTCSILFSQQNKKINRLTGILDQRYSKGEISQKDLLKYMTDLYDLSKYEGFVEGQLKSIIETAKINYDYGYFNASLKKINEGVAIAKLEKNSMALCRLFLIYQRILIKLDQFHESQDALKKCEYYNSLVSENDERDINHIFILLGKAELLVDANGLSKDMDTVVSLKREAYSQAMLLRDNDKYKKFIVINTLESLAWSLALAEKLSEAREVVIKIDDLLMKYPNEEFITQSFVIKGAIENISKDYQQAIKYFSIVIERSAKNRNTYNFFEITPMISASYGQIGDFEEATKYSWKYAHLLDSINSANKKSNNITLIKNINLSAKDKQRVISDVNKMLLYGILVLIISIELLLFYQRIKRNSLVLPFITNKEDKFQKEEIDITIKVMRLINFAKDDINVYYVEFQKIYPYFYQNLKDRYPKLNINDLNYCSFVKMNFNNEQIAEYTQTTLKSVESRRYRILKKIEIKSTSDLYILLSKL